MRERPSDLLASEEPAGPDELVADAGRGEGVLDPVDHIQPPGENSDFLLFGALLELGLDLPGDPFRLLGVAG